MDPRTTLEGTCRHYRGIGAVGRGEPCLAGVDLRQWLGMLPCWRGEAAATMRCIGRFGVGPEPEPCPWASFRSRDEVDAALAAMAPRPDEADERIGGQAGAA